jgi:LuxR family transcriptional regulator, maltose regulon positive regulatory protein
MEEIMEKLPGTFAKVTPPLIGRIHHRGRLYTLLEEDAGRPVCWLSGPAGSGKTTLIADYLQHRKSSCLWYQIDSGDNDPASFFYYMGMAAQKVSPSMRDPLPLFTPEYIPGLPLFARRFFESLFNQLPLPAVVVFDNYQKVPEDAALHDILRCGLDIIPNGIRFFICSRTLPPPCLTRLHINGVMACLEWKDLRLTLEEAMGVTSLKLEGTIPAGTVRRLYKRTDGWVAGLILMLERMQSLPVKDSPLEAFTEIELFDYFAGEIFDRSSEELQAFLLGIAFVPEFSLDIARALSGNERAEVLLNSLERKNYFITRYAGRVTFCRLHPLFRDFLKAKARELLSEDALTALQERSAEALEGAGELDAAAELWLDIRNWEAVVRLVRQYGKSLLDQGRFRMLANWLERLPEEVVQQNPWMLLFKSLSRQPVAPNEAYQLAADAYRGFRQCGDITGALLAWATVVDVYVLSFSDLKALDGWIAEMDSLNSDYARLPKNEIKARVACSMFVALSLKQPNHPQIQEWAGSALALCDALANGEEMVRIRYWIILYLNSYSGNTVKSGRYLAEIQQLTRTRDIPPRSRIPAWGSECQCFLLGVEPQKAHAAAINGLELSSQAGVPFLDIVLHTYAANCCLDMGRLREAAEHIAACETMLRPFDRWALFFFQLAKTRFLMLQGDLGQAQTLIDQNLTLSESIGIWFVGILAELQKAQLLCLQGKRRPALACIEQAERFESRWNSPCHKCLIRLEKARIEVTLGEKGRARQALLEALRHAKSLGLMISYNLDLPASTADMCALAIEEGIEADFAREMVRKRKLVPATPPTHLETWPWPLKVHTLGGLSILSDDKPVRFGRKTPRKPLELLALMVAFDGIRASEEKIADILWPDADGDRAQQSLKNTLKRLRKLAGHSQVVAKKGRYIALDRRHVWTDVWAFESLYSRITAVQDSTTCEDEVRRVWQQDCEAALNLFEGDFLGDESWAPEIIAKRDQVQHQAVHIARMLGPHYEKSQQWKKAADLYEKILTTVEREEFFYGRLMQCYKKLGSAGKAMATYARCRSVMSRTTNTEPSSWIEEIRESIGGMKRHRSSG